MLHLIGIVYVAAVAAYLPAVIEEARSHDATGTAGAVKMALAALLCPMFGLARVLRGITNR